MALGEVGLSLADFDSLSLPAFSEVINHYKERKQEEWERVRFLAMFSIQPYSKKALKPEDVCTFPWETKAEEKEEDIKKLRERAKEIAEMVKED